MKIFCISDNVDTAVGLRLSGVESIILHEKEEVIKELEELIKNKEIGIIAVTNKIYTLASEKILEIENNLNIPLIIKIPDRHGS